MQKVIEGKGDNVVFSPYSVYSMLAMLALGTNRTTKEQITSALKWKPGEDHWTAISLMRGYFEEDDNQVGSTLDVANNGWVARGMNMLDEFQNKMEDIFGVTLNVEDFSQSAVVRDRINKWVSDNTGQNIPELFPPKSFNSLTKMVIANAVYFKGAWTIPFDKSNTNRDVFTKEDGSNIQVDYMYRSGKFQHTADGDVEVLELPYGDNGRFSMLFVKPRDNGEMSKLSKNMDGKSLGKFMSSLNKNTLEIWIPKFTIKKALDLVDVLRRLRVTDAFSTRYADFSRITGEKELFVSSAQHKAYIKVDETGTTAAGASGVGMAAVSMPPSFNLDRPFLFFVVNKRCNTIIFSGKVMDPTQ
jgi:serpin B